MGLFGFNADKKLSRARKALAEGDFYEALKNFEEVEKRQDVEAGVRAEAASEGKRVRGLMVDQRVLEARTLLSAGELEAARDRLETARDLAGSDLPRDAIEAGFAALERTSVDAAAAHEAAQSPLHNEDAPRLPEEPEEGDLFGSDFETEFALLLDTLPPGLANVFREQSLDFRKAYIALAKGAPRTALRYLDHLVWDPLPDPAVAVERARAELMTGAARQALERLEGLPDLSMVEVRHDADVLKIEALRDLERYGEAVELAKALAPPEPGRDRGADSMLATTLLEAGRPDEALDRIEPWLRSAQPSDEVHVLAAHAMRLQGRGEEAIPQLEALIQGSIQASLGSGKEPTFPVEPARALLELYLELGSPDPRKVRVLALHLLDFDPNRGEQYRQVLVRS